MNDAGRTTVAEGGTVILSPARVGESSQVEFTVENSGNAALAVSAIDVISTNGVFALERSPELPVSLEPGAATRFNVRFSPNATGSASASLRINNTTFTLAGNGREPVPLPPYRFEGPSGVQQPMQQPSVGLSLDGVYPLSLRGVLTLSFVSDVFTENTAVQFSTGGRLVAFTIPANTTRAIFENGSTEVKLQTGTVAGVIQLRPAFATQSGFALAVADPVQLSMTINRAAPQLLSGEIAGRTTNGIGIVITGYSTTRTLRQLDIQLSPAGGATFTATKLSVNVEPASVVWFQSPQSQALGGLFSLSVPVTFQRGGSTEDLVRYLQSVSVTVSNDVGVSNAINIVP
jgi:hypothetical protein